MARLLESHSMPMFLRPASYLLSRHYLACLSLYITLILCQKSASPQAAAVAEWAPGTILIEVSDPRHYWQYEVQPQTGSVRLVKEQQLKGDSSDEMPKTFQQPAGAIQHCDKAPQATSPNGSYIAECRVLRKKDHSPLRDQFVLTEAGSASSYPWNPEEWRGIHGLAWSANSRHVAILNCSEHYSKSPVGVLSGMSGHPIPSSTVFLDIIDVRTGRVTEYMLRKNVKYVFTRILRWSE